MHAILFSTSFSRIGLKSASARLGLTLVCISFLLTACTMPPTSQQSPVDLPAEFSARSETALPDRWWLSFDDRALNDLVEQALSGNLSLMVAWDRLAEVRAVARSVGADLAPTLDAEIDASRSWFREDGGTDQQSSFGVGLVAGYEVDLWGRIRSRHEAALLDVAAGREDLQTAALTLSAEVAATWYQLIEQRGQQTILEQQIATNSKVLELITLQFRTGQVGIADVLQQRQLIETNRGELARIRSRVQVLQHQLAVLVGLSPDRIVAPAVARLGTLPALPDAGLPADLVQRRPDIRAAWVRLQAADRRLAAAIAERFPRLSLSGRLGSEADTVGDLFDNWLASLAGNLLTPLVDGGRRQAEVDANRAVVSRQLHTYGQAVLDALAEVENALVRERQQHQYIQNLERQQELAERAIERIRDRYLKGGEDYQRVLTALLSLQNVQRNRLTAERELFEFRIQLCRALAGSWPLTPPAVVPAG